MAGDGHAGNSGRPGKIATSWLPPAGSNKNLPPSRWDSGMLGAARTAACPMANASATVRPTARARYNDLHSNAWRDIHITHARQRDDLRTL